MSGWERYKEKRKWDNLKYYLFVLIVALIVIPLAFWLQIQIDRWYFRWILGL